MSAITVQAPSIPSPYSNLGGMSNPPNAPGFNATIQRIAINALQSRSVSVERLERYVYHTYRLRTSDSFFYLLRCRPPADVRLLRHEENWLFVEAAAIYAIGSRIGRPMQRVIEFQAVRSASPLGSQYLIAGPFEGSIFADVEPSLSRDALSAIDRSLGQYMRNLSLLSGPPSFFGFMRPPTPGSPGGFNTWAQAFAFILETVLRDAEDLGLGLPFDAIRSLVQSQRAVLNQIVTPRFTLLEGANDQNVVVDVHSFSVIGLADFGSAIWGDPFMADVFYTPKLSFSDGFGKLPNKTSDERARQYLYVIYHSLLAIVRSVHRPNNPDEVAQARQNLMASMRRIVMTT